jgi:DNA replication protein DnaC
VLELARSEYVLRRENVIAVGFTTAASLAHELIEARDDERLRRQLAGYKLLVIDELGYVPLSQTGTELRFEVSSQRYE